MFLVAINLDHIIVIGFSKALSEDALAKNISNAYTIAVVLVIPIQIIYECFIYYKRGNNWTHMRAKEEVHRDNEKLLTEMWQKEEKSRKSSVVKNDEENPPVVGLKSPSENQTFTNVFTLIADDGTN